MPKERRKSPLPLPVPAGARRAPMPDEVPAPQLCKLAASVPTGNDWIHEIKFDGYRVICRLDRESPHPLRLYTRNGQDWSSRFPSLLRPLLNLPLQTAILDGEVVVLDREGRPDFQMLQSSFRKKDKSAHVYFLFDLLYFDGFDLSRCPLIERKSLLRDLLTLARAAPSLRYSSHLTGHGKEAYREACRTGLEGIISKKALSRSFPARSSSWLKIKCALRQEFVIGGYTPPKGSRSSFGALLVGTFQKGRLIYRGRVGTGFTDQSLQKLATLLDEHATKVSPFIRLPYSATRGVRWVEPKLIAEVEFAGWTADSVMRHPSFKGLREDKTPFEVSLELPPRPAGFAAPGRPSRLTHPDRVHFPEAGITKEDIFNYYSAIAPRILPFITRCPLMVLRCPEGRAGKCFHQKHLSHALRAQASGSGPIRGISVSHDERPYIAIDGAEGLLLLVQLNSLEFHPWASREGQLEKPRFATFDLDPGNGVEWDTVAHAARDIRSELESLGLRSFLKTTGGKGLHVVIPLTPKAEWAEVKQFTRKIAVGMARRAPEKYTASASKKRRDGKIFIDYLRNSRGATSVAPYSTRARSNATVSVPISWKELDQGVDPAQFTPRNVLLRIRDLDPDPWADFFRVRQSLTRKLKAELGLSF